MQQRTAAVSPTISPEINLRSRTEGAETTQYLYSSTGELQRVTLPDDTLIEYINDLQTCKRSGKINKNTHRTNPDSFSN
jgi:hypothetical protein